MFLLLGYLALTLVQKTEVSIFGTPSRDFIWIIGITELAVYVWMRAFARVSFLTQVVVLTVLFGLQPCVYRVDGFMGDGYPILVWRWTPSANQNWKNVQRNEKSEPTASTADLTTTTKFDYPSFRGNDSAGTVKTVRLARNWTQPPQQLWRQPVGLGWSSFAVVGNYCVTQEQRGDFEIVVCYELRTGREVWKHSDLACFDEVTGGKGPRATPTIHDGRVFSLGATGILNCLDGSNGQRIWSTNILEDIDAENALFGMAGSPLIVEGLVVVSPGGKGGSLVAYDQQTGTRVWAGGEVGTSYSSPQFADFVDQSQIVIFNAEGLFGHDVDSGIVLWSYLWVSNPEERNNVCQPVILTDDAEHPRQVFISSGYGQGCALLEITKKENTYDVRERWSNRNLKAKFSSVVRHGTHVYGFDGSILVCIDLATGKRCWKGGRYGYGQLILADDVIIVQAESGDIVLVSPTPERHHELARFAALNHRTWNHPVVSGDILLVRNDREAACYQLPRAVPPNSTAYNVPSNPF